MTRARTILAVVALAMSAGAVAVPIAAGEGLPDGRVYEQVSPVQKNGSDAGLVGGNLYFSMATPDGNGFFYRTRGSMGEAVSGLQEYTVGLRGVNGWSARSAVPAIPLEHVYSPTHTPLFPTPSSDLSELVFAAFGTYTLENPDSSNRESSGALYLGHGDKSVDWLTRPQIPNPEPTPGNISAAAFEVVGASPDLSTMYFESRATLLPSDASRGPGVGGLYEYSKGTLRSAGTLPNGTQDPRGAAQASTSPGSTSLPSTITADAAGNQVSRDGSTLWFVSPDPGGNPGYGPVTQLYLRRAGHSTLVSHTPDGSPAPDGVLPVYTLTPGRDPIAHQYAYGSPDGSMAIFQSSDALAPGAPNDSSLKSYSYDVATNTVSYLPGVAGATVVAASDNGHRFLFGQPGSQIALWDEGTVKTIPFTGLFNNIAPARATADGSVFVFSTEATIGGANGGGATQIYRYDVAREETTCLSCPPQGIVPLSGEGNGATLAPSIGGEVIAARGMSTDAQRVFFDTPNALVPRDTNGQRDVYEWTPSGVSLISSGRSAEPSYLLDNSASGNDVFFTTSEGLVPADKDGAYDVYDARVGGGFKQTEVSAPCTGDGCQGSLSGSLASLTPGSAGFFGAGNQLSSGPPAAGSTSKAGLKLGARRLTRSGLVLTLSIPRAGRVTVTGVGLRRFSRSFPRAGSFKVRVALARGLRGSRSVVRVGFTADSGAASTAKFILSAKA